MRRVKFNDGEAVVFSDFDMIAQLADRAACRAFRQMIQVAVDDAGADSPLLVRGSEPSHSGTGTRTITLTNGLWCAAEDNPPAAVSDAPEVYFGDAVGAAYTLDANSGAVYRRDILQAKIDAASDTGSETRDYKNPTTGVVSTQSFNKRSIRTMTLSVKKGTDQASEALADANEPAPDAGYVKIFSFLIDNAGACEAAKRKRYTIGALRRKRIFSAAAGIIVTGTASVVGDVVRIDDTAARVLIPYNVESGRRIRRLTARMDPTGGDTTRIRLRRPLVDAATLDIASGVSDGTTTVQTVDTGLFDELTPSIADASYLIEIDKTADGAGAGTLVGAVVVTED